MSTLSWYSNKRLSTLASSCSLRPGSRQTRTSPAVYLVAPTGPQSAVNVTREKALKHGDVSIEHWDFPWDISMGIITSSMFKIVFGVCLCVCIATMEDDMDG